MIQQEFAFGARIVVHPVAKSIFFNVGVVEPYLSMLDSGKGIFDFPSASPEGFHLRATKHNTRLKEFHHVVVSFRLGITGEIRSVWFLGHGPCIKRPEDHASGRSKR